MARGTRKRTRKPREEEAEDEEEDPDPEEEEAEDDALAWSHEQQVAAPTEGGSSQAAARAQHMARGTCSI